MSSKQQTKWLQDELVRHVAVYKEGEEAYYKMLCNYCYNINPYKDSPHAWYAYKWQCGFQHAYYEQNRDKLAKYNKEPEPDTTYNFRNEGESTGVDRYFGRGL